VQDAQAGPLAQLPDLPGTAPADTAAWIRRVLAGDAPVPPPIAQQVAHIVALTRTTFASPAADADTPQAHAV
jgi:anthranilate phosphoribosyltransferase